MQVSSSRANEMLSKDRTIGVQIDSFDTKMVYFFVADRQTIVKRQRIRTSRGKWFTKKTIENIPLIRVKCTGYTPLSVLYRGERSFATNKKDDSMRLTGTTISINDFHRLYLSGTPTIFVLTGVTPPPAVTPPAVTPPAVASPAVTPSTVAGMTDEEYAALLNKLITEIFGDISGKNWADICETSKEAV